MVAEFFRDLQKPARFSGGGGSSRIFPGHPKAGANQSGGRLVVNEFPLMGPFYFCAFPKGGARAPPESATAYTYIPLSNYKAYI